ncbi:MAG: alpha/beta hydrolase [Candidatus Marinarcus sp.]|uniref:alpha/beta hydrolase n=1 Tax=Candidatus Marinarcus sp. TaxID=3100987 RepID=UPI003B00DC66
MQFRRILLIFSFFIVNFLFANEFVLSQQKIETAKYQATLSYKIAQNSQKAVLYIHGFNDYFFNKMFAKEFYDNGYSFFALDLHNYGRNLTPTSKPYYFTHIEEFDDEITQTIELMKEKFAIEDITLYGYSQGGLISALYANKYGNVNRLILDSPFLDFNFNAFLENIALPVVAKLGQFFPTFKIESNEPNIFGQSLHKDFYGEWDFDTHLKSTQTNAPIYLGWINAIYQAQKKIHKGIDINLPILCLYSSMSQPSSSEKKFHHSSDIVLSVKDIKKYSQNLNKNKKLTQHVEIKNAMHGVIFSQKDVRNEAYKIIFNWLNSKS